ncbi:hypothetical protein [Aquabacterium sp.]|nr:hypothetical protein [Aquabacterium sp.]
MKELLVVWVNAVADAGFGQEMARLCRVILQLVPQVDHVNVQVLGAR